jgi:hypothetical protein
MTLKTRAEIAAHYNVCPDTIAVLRRKGMPATVSSQGRRHGWQYVFDLEQVDKWLHRPQTRKILSRRMQDRLLPPLNLSDERTRQSKGDVWISSKLIGKYLGIRPCAVRRFWDQPGNPSPKTRIVGRKKYYKVKITIGWTPDNENNPE